MAITLIFEIGQVSEHIRNLLKGHPFSEFICIDDILIKIFEIASGALSDGCDISNILLNYKIPPYVTLGLLPTWVGELRTPEFTSYLQKYDIFKYDVEYRIIGPDLYVVLHPKQTVLSLEQQYRLQLQQEMDEWAYIPERIRRELQL